MKDVADAVRSVRKALGKSQDEFAEILGCRRNTVSRYELGKLMPGPIILVRMLDVAENAGLARLDATQRIQVLLRGQFAQGLFGSAGGGFDQAVALGRTIAPGLVREMTLSGELLSSLSESKRNDPSFRKFAVAVAQVIEECDAIDDSIIGILELWAAHCQRPGAAERFRDALGFLRARLWCSAESQGQTEPNS
jgi:transcriptional regulator with XRE-family HTH domain